MWFFYIIAIIMIILGAYIDFIEIRSLKKKGDLFMDTTISLLLIGVAIYNLVDSKWDFTKILSYLFVIVLLEGLVSLVFVIIHQIYLKKQKNVD